MTGRKTDLLPILERYLQYCLCIRNYAPRTLQSYRDVFRLFMGVTGAVYLEEMTKPLLEPWFFQGRMERKYTFCCVNDVTDNEELFVPVGSDVFILGYPEGLNYADLPIWKRGSVASEPRIAIDHLPKMLIDTATRKGMSGSCVIAAKHGIFSVNNGNNISKGSAGKLLGVYSGRVKFKVDPEEKYTEEPEDIMLRAQLGIVWKKEVILEIIKGKKRGCANPPLFQKEAVL